MTRFAYALLWWLATPFAFVRLAWRARRQPGYLERWGERLGFYAPADKVPRIWIHAVSLGETRAAAPLVEALTARYPRHRILLTHMTPTGRQAGRELFGDRVERAWLPYDHGFAVRRFLAHFAPAIGIVMETEIWPRLLEECARQKVPTVLANARLSERSARRYARWPRITRWALGNVAGIAAQTREDAARFETLGANAPFVMGNVKFDMTVPAEMLERGAALRARLGDARRVWVAGSTRDGEEALLLDAFIAADPDPSVILVIVPRHPQRFEEVAAAVAARGLALARRSDNAPLVPQTRVVLGDSLGEMLAYYAASDVVIMGGSFLPFGSQNLIEACAVGRPVIVGPSTFNFEEAAARAVAEGAAVRVRDAADAIAQAARLSKDEIAREQMGSRGRDFVAAHRGAVERFVGWLAPRVKA